MDMLGMTGAGWAWMFFIVNIGFVVAGVAIVYFLVKLAVKNGIKEAYRDLMQGGGQLPGTPPAPGGGYDL